MLYGCPYELFWKLNPVKLQAFAKAYEQKIEVDNKMMDAQAWLNGMYVMQAIAVCFGKKSNKYPEKPNSQRDFAMEEAIRIREFMKSHSQYMREKKRRKKETQKAEQAEVKSDG